VVISKHRGYTIRAIPANWSRAKDKGFTHHVTGNRSSMYGRNLPETRELVAFALWHDRYSGRPFEELRAMLLRHKIQRA